MTTQHPMRRALVVASIFVSVFWAASIAPANSLKPTQAAGADLAAAGLITATDAGALAPAQRLRVGRTPVFPMQTTPKCYILDDFGDPRPGGRIHEGSDMLATLGQEVYAATDGTLTQQVLASSLSAGASLSGNLWTLTAGDSTYYVYAHLSAFAAGLSKGSIVHQGDLIGYVGDTGNAGPGNYHLHFEIHPNGGAPVNPLPLLTIPRECSVH